MKKQKVLLSIIDVLITFFLRFYLHLSEFVFVLLFEYIKNKIYLKLNDNMIFSGTAFLKQVQFRIYIIFKKQQKKSLKKINE